MIGNKGSNLHIYIYIDIYPPPCSQSTNSVSGLPWPLARSHAEAMLTQSFKGRTCHPLMLRMLSSHFLGASFSGPKNGPSKIGHWGPFGAPNGSKVSHKPCQMEPWSFTLGALVSIWCRCIFHKQNMVFNTFYPFRMVPFSGISLNIGMLNTPPPKKAKKSVPSSFFTKNITKSDPNWVPLWHTNSPLSQRATF